MKRLIIALGALALLTVPQAAFAKKSDEGSRASTEAPPPAQAAQPNFHATGTGSAVPCGAGCTDVSGTYTSNQFSGPFSGRITTASGVGCSAVQGTITLVSGSDSAVAGISGTLCGTNFFGGSYRISSGTGAYQSNGAGWGDFGYTNTHVGAFSMSADGTFFPQEWRDGS